MVLDSENPLSDIKLHVNHLQFSSTYTRLSIQNICSLNSFLPHQDVLAFRNPIKCIKDVCFNNLIYELNARINSLKSTCFIPPVSTDKGSCRGKQLTSELICSLLPVEMEVSQAVHTSECPSVTRPCARLRKKIKIKDCCTTVVKDGNRRVEDGTVFQCLFIGNRVTWKPFWGSDAPQQALTFRYYAQLG